MDKMIRDASNSSEPVPFLVKLAVGVNLRFPGHEENRSGRALFCVMQAQKIETGIVGHSYRYPPVCIIIRYNMTMCGKFSYQDSFK